MGSLLESIKDPSKRPGVVDDCVRLIDAEVSDKGGFSGVAIKGAYKTVKGLKPNMIGMSMDALLDDFAGKLDPFWLDCQAKGARPRDFFVSKKSEVANALLEITDQRAAKSRHKVLVRAYKGLRGKAVSHIGDAMPRFSELLVKHAS